MENLPASTTGCQTLARIDTDRWKPALLSATHQLVQQKSPLQRCAHSAPHAAQPARAPLGVRSLHPSAPLSQVLCGTDALLWPRLSPCPFPRPRGPARCPRAKSHTTPPAPDLFWRRALCCTAGRQATKGHPRARSSCSTQRHANAPRGCPPRHRGEPAMC